MPRLSSLINPPLRNDASHHLHRELHQPRHTSSLIFQSSLLPRTPVNGDYLHQHMEMASRVLVMRCLAVSLLSAVLVGLLTAVLWMSYSDLGVCLQDPPLRRGMGVLTSWDHTLNLGSSAHYRCVKHQMAPLVLSLQCSSRRRWEILTLYNESCVCVDPPPPTVFQSYLNTSDRRVGTTVAYHCDPYHHSVPVQTAQCTFSKIWTRTRFNTSCWGAPYYASLTKNSLYKFDKFSKDRRPNTSL